MQKKIDFADDIIGAILVSILSVLATCTLFWLSFRLLKSIFDTTLIYAFLYVIIAVIFLIAGFVFIFIFYVSVKYILDELRLK